MSITENTGSGSLDNAALGIGRIQHPICWQTANRVAKNRERRRAYQKAWYLKKLAKLRAKRRAAYPRFREQELARSRAYYYAHRAAVRARQHRYYLQKKAEKQQVYRP